MKKKEKKADGQSVSIKMVKLCRYYIGNAKVNNIQWFMPEKNKLFWYSETLVRN